MKTTKFFLGAFAALLMGATMASCSNDEPAAGGENNENSSVGDRYISVRIFNPSNTSRAAGEGFEEGVGNENAISAENIRFYFFNANQQPFTLVASNVNGELSNTNMVKPISLTPNTQDGNEVTANGVLVLGKPTSPYLGVTPSYMICAANLTDSEFKELANKTMRDAANIIRSKATGESLDWGTFVMTNSTYIKDGEKVIATKIEDENLAESAVAAQANPVNIYVERLAAKVRVTGLDVYQPQKAGDNPEKVTFNFSNAEGQVEETTLYVNLNGWQLKNRYTKAKLFKDIDADGDYFPNWNAPEYHRCYWAITPADESGLFNKTYDIYSSTQFTLGNYNAAKPTENIRYTYPNTAWASTPESASDRTTNVTSVIVRGVVCTDATGATPLDFVYWAGGYYKTAEFKKMVANAYNVENTGANKTADDITLVADNTNPNQWIASVKLNETENYRFDRFNGISWWQNGLTSYNVNIKHATTADGTALYGVVRNHIYENIFTGVVGLGVPGNEPENPKDETETYVAATVNVLNWKLVSNTIVLE